MFFSLRRTTSNFRQNLANVSFLKTGNKMASRKEEQHGILSKQTKYRGKGKWGRGDWRESGMKLSHDKQCKMSV